MRGLTKWVAQNVPRSVGAQGSVMHGWSVLLLALCRSTLALQPPAALPKTRLPAVTPLRAHRASRRTDHPCITERI